MGNLLGSPVTSKETERGSTPDGRLVYAVSSMQGWRVHMEDAHIVQPVLYAERRTGGGDGGGDNDGGGASIEASLSADGGDDEISVEESPAAPASSNDTPTSSSNADRERIDLPDHSLFAVFDGHGGQFAADYSSRNLLRVLSRQDKFVSYAARWNGRAGYLDGLRGELAEEDAKAGDNANADAGDDSNSAEDAASSPASTTEDEEKDDRERRLRQLRDRGMQSDEKTKKIKEQVRRHLDGDASTSNPEAQLSKESQRKYDVAKASYDHELMTDLEDALQDAFCDVDAEIMRAVQGRQVDGANSDYNAGVSSGAPAAHHGSEPVVVEDEDAGTTACCVLLTPLWIVCANAGDSRSVYARSGRRCVPLSYDHKPDDEGEERRVRDAGGYVSGGRVEGDLAVSRGLGDFRFKEADVVLGGSRGERAERSKKHRRLVMGTAGGSVYGSVAGGAGPGDEGSERPRPSEQKVSPVPDIIVQSRDEGEDEFVLIACDGIWDVVGNQEGVNMVAEVFGEGEEDVGLICEEVSFPLLISRRAGLSFQNLHEPTRFLMFQVLDLCLMKGSKDNMTAAVIKFPRQTVGSGGGVAARRAMREAPASPAGSGGDGPSPELYVPPQKRALSESNMVDEDAEE